MAASDDNAAPVPAASGSMPFIVSSNDGKTAEATKKFIRSHAMRGRKQNRTRPRKNILVNGYELTAGSVKQPNVDFEDIMRLYLPPERSIGGDVSFLPTPEDLEPSILSKVMKVSPIAQKIVYPLATAVGSTIDKRDWIEICSTDAAALHITAFSIETFVDMFLLRREQANPGAMVHYQKAISSMRERLDGDDEKLKTSDASIGVVCKLATSAHFAGDPQAERQHIIGVRKMVDSRGGLIAFKDNHLLYEILKCDLFHAVFSASKPVFFLQPTEPIPSYPFNLLPDFNGTAQTADTLEITERLDADLAGAWAVMRRFTLLVNLGTQTERLISTKVINETMTSVMYRLLYMRYASGSLDEGVRLVLLIYCYHVFLQWRDLKLPCPGLESALRESILVLEQSAPISPRYMLWMLMVAAISIFDVQKEEWLRAALRYHARDQETPWTVAQDILKSFLWIALLDEDPARAIWESIA